MTATESPVLELQRGQTLSLEEALHRLRSNRDALAAAGGADDLAVSLLDLPETNRRNYHRALGRIAEGAYPDVPGFSAALIANYRLLAAVLESLRDFADALARSGA